MASESTAFGLSILITIVGLAILLYGVSLNSGQSLNNYMLVGGGVVVMAIAIHTAAIMRLDSSYAAA